MKYPSLHSLNNNIEDGGYNQESLNAFIENKGLLIDKDKLEPEDRLKFELLADHLRILQQVNETNN